MNNTNKKIRLLMKADFAWSGLRGSNPPPRPWQGRALPNELNPRKLEAPPGIGPGIKVLQTSALPLGYGALLSLKIGCFFKHPWSGLRGSNSLPPPWQGGALPDELHPHINFKMATRNGLEPSTSSVTG